MSSLNDDPNRRVRVQVGGGGGSRGARTETFASSVNGGEHFHVFPSDAQIETVRSWKKGAWIDCQYKDGRPDFLSFQEANHFGQTMREKRPGGQRGHFVLKTSLFGKIDGSVKPVAVESWVEGSGFCVRVAHLFASAEKQS
jgi:hypothetical protein